jgi:hypothetical protein
LTSFFRARETLTAYFETTHLPSGRFSMGMPQRLQMLA